MTLRPLLAAGIVVAAGLPAHALIVQPSTATLTPTTPSGAVGRWGGNAGAVAIAPNYVLTTRHQDGNTGALRDVVFNGVTYDSAESWTFGSNIDLQLVRIEKDGADANLTQYVALYDSAITSGTTTVLVSGYGPTIGPADGSDGYDWAGTTNNANALNFGQNRVDATGAIDEGTYAGMEVLQVDFDQAGVAGSREYEATFGIGDSGGGWFVAEGGQWKLVGLTFGIDNDEAGVHPADAFFGQTALAVDIRPYVDDINAIIVPEPATAVLLGAAAFGLMRRRGH